ncbi:MAG: PIN domain-containing protein [Nanoarchaeota archaeon]
MIFLDSSFLISYYNSLDKHTNKAQKIMDKLITGKYGDPCISDYIFDEVVTVLFIRSKDKSVAITLGEILKNSLEIISINQELFDKAWNIFKNQKNTSFSFTDCTNLAVMQEYGLSHIVTFDEDFSKFEGIKVIGI